MATIKEIIEYLSNYEPDNVPINEIGNYFIIPDKISTYPILSTQPFIGICKKCEQPVVEELDTNIDYPYFCPTCDENMYEHEIVNL